MLGGGGTAAALQQQQLVMQQQQQLGLLELQQQQQQAMDMYTMYGSTAGLRGPQFTCFTPHSTVLVSLLYCA
jgi:hypothetical protein